MNAQELQLRLSAAASLKANLRHRMADLRKSSSTEIQLTVRQFGPCACCIEPRPSPFLAPILTAPLHASCAPYAVCMHVCMYVCMRCAKNVCTA